MFFGGSIFVFSCLALVGAWTVAGWLQTWWLKRQADQKAPKQHNPFG